MQQLPPRLAQDQPPQGPGYRTCPQVSRHVARRVKVAHAWVDAALFAIRNDFARPTVHARNLYHLSVAMYDAWAAYDEKASTLWLHPEARFEQCHIAARPDVRANSDTIVDIERRAAVGQAA